MIDHRAVYRLAGRALTGLLIAVMYAPLAMVFIYSFNASKIGSVWTGFSTRWYGELARDRDLREGLGMSLRVGLVASTASVVLGTLAALGLRHWRLRPRQIARGLLALPLVVPDIIIAVALAVFFHTLGVRRGTTTIVLAHVSFGLSYAFVVMSAAVADLDEDLRDPAPGVRERHRADPGPQPGRRLAPGLRPVVRRLPDHVLH
jgi:ABC-type spermidine/putrescine transport system permease subunit II